MCKIELQPNLSLNLDRSPAAPLRRSLAAG